MTGRLISPRAGPDGQPLFPLDDAHREGAAFTFVAGNPEAHRRALEDLRGGTP